MTSITSMDAMDAISALDTAACILSITEFITNLLTSPDPPVQPLLSLSREDEPTISILENVKTLKAALCDIQMPSVPQVSANASQPTSNVPALQDLVSARDDSSALLENIESILRSLADDPRSQPWEDDARAWLRSQLADANCVQKSEQLSYAVTHHVSFILRYVVQSSMF